MKGKRGKSIKSKNLILTKYFEQFKKILNKFMKPTILYARNSLILFFILIVGIVGYNALIKKNLEYEEFKDATNVSNLKKYIVSTVKNNYKDTVRVYRDSYLYKIIDDKLEIAGTISKDNIIKIEQSNIDETLKEKDFFYKITSLDEEYYILYDNITSYDSDIEEEEFKYRFKNYIPFNENIVTNEKTSFYKNGKLRYTFYKSFNLPIYVKNNDSYSVVFNNELLEVKKEDVKNTIPNSNSNELKAKEVPVLLYHFIYDQSKETCNEVICNSIKQVRSHLDYMKNNSYFTPTMDEFEKFIDGKINLPKKSVLITIDDGGYAHNAKALFNEYKYNATLFLVTSWFDKNFYESDYLEIHSHTHNMHRNYVCSGGNQGGAMLCSPYNELLGDLKKSRELTNNSVALAYPFYDYNNHVINVAKDAGFRMGFGGYYEGGSQRMKIGGNKFKIPRYTILNSTALAYVRYAIGG